MKRKHFLRCIIGLAFAPLATPLVRYIVNDIPVEPVIGTTLPLPDYYAEFAEKYNPENYKLMIEKLYNL